MIYNWKKENKDQQYKGSKFHLVWALSKGDEGVSIYLVATVKDGQKMEFEGSSYVLEKKEGKWKAIKRLALKNGSKILESKDWMTKFPKRSNTNDSIFHQKTDPHNYHYWGFLDSQGKNVLPISGNETTRNLWWKWKTSEHGIYKIQNWSENFDVWWEHFFGTDKLNMKQLMGDLLGAWDGS